MIVFFRTGKTIYAVEASQFLAQPVIKKLKWLFDNARLVNENTLTGGFIGPRKEMITPWSTNAVEITQNMGIRYIHRIEVFSITAKESPEFDPMLQAVY